MPGTGRRVRTAITRGLAAVPLRVTLVVALVILAGLGLLISGVVVTSVMQRVVVGGVDRQLFDAAHIWARPDARLPARLPPMFYIRTTNAEGAVEVRSAPSASTPDLPGDLGNHPQTVGSIGNPSDRWRAMEVVHPDGVSVVAVHLDQSKNIVDRLLALQIVVGLAVLAVLAAVAQLVIRRSLRPLRAVERTASEIAGGDLDRRVPVYGTRTEVDLLSQSLNGMLTQIQQAFAATEASEEAARRSEAKMRRFVADASHELRTPLTTIQGFAELYRQGAVPEPELLMDRIERESKRMGLLVEDLLMLARLDAQRPLERKPVDLLAIASDAVHNLRALDATRNPAGPPRPIDLEIRSGEGTLEIPGDEARLRQVLGNLAGNALVHTSAGTSVTVRLTPAEHEVLMEVVDTGPGLPPEEAERIFERFYRTDTSRSRDSGGTGLGLSIVQALVASHGGTVSVDSTLGEGTTFTVRLPREPS
jgi:two-component system OmpR family sensor kinase